MDIPHIDELFYLERDGLKYRGIAFDGCHFYLTERNNIHVYDLSMRKVKHIQTCGCYTSICHDPTLDCFWALSDNDWHAYRLDSNLCEIDSICLPYALGKPTGISCSENDNELLITADNNIYCISKFGYMNAYKVNSISGALYLCACDIDSGYLCSAIFQHGNTIKLHNSCKTSCSILLPDCYMTAAMTCGRCCHEAFLLVVKDNCYYRILRCYTKKCKCRSQHKDNCCDPCKDSRCNHHSEICCDCKEPCCDKKQCCKADHCLALCRRRCKEQELCDIIESIALTETALSHILNAEGEKLQKILELSDKPETILETNKSISATIAKVTHLEYVLFEKLQMVQEMSNCEKVKSCCDKDGKCDKDCCKSLCCETTRYYEKQCCHKHNDCCEQNCCHEKNCCCHEQYDEPYSSNQDYC